MARETPFVDRSVSDLDRLLDGGPPEVRAIVLDKKRVLDTKMGGGATRGRRWVQPPLTDAGLERYAGILAFEITVTGTLPSGNTTRSVTHYVIDMAGGTIVSQVLLPDAVKKNNSVSLIVKVPSLARSFAIGTFDDAGNFQASTFLRVNNPATDNQRATEGAVSR